VKIKIFSDFQGIRYNRSMAILDNLENSDFLGDNGEYLPFFHRYPCYPDPMYDISENKDIQFEHQNLAVKIFTDTCCNSCNHKSESDHIIKQ
jgi:hypothetical protein